MSGKNLIQTFSGDMPELDEYIIDESPILDDALFDNPTSEIVDFGDKGFKDIVFNKNEMPDEIPVFEDFEPPIFDTGEQQLSDKRPSPSSYRIQKIPIQDQITIGTDTEFIQLEGDSVGVLSYQYALITPDGRECSGIIYPESTDPSDRLSLSEFLKRVILRAIEAGILTAIPERVHVVAHFTRADLGHFKGVFADLKNYGRNVRKTLVTADDTYGIDLEKLESRSVDKDPICFEIEGGYHRMGIEIYDTMLLAPNGKKLSDIGDLVGIPKVDIPPPYSIERMDEFLAGDKATFETYAVTDAVIAARYFQEVVGFVQSLGMTSIPKTIGGIAVNRFKASFPGGQSEFNDYFGYKIVQRTRWPTGSGRPITSQSREFSTGLNLIHHWGVEGYHGGRNEAFLAGATDIDEWNDFDLQSCYTNILQGLRPLDYDNCRFTQSLDEFEGDICGIAWISFCFPSDVRYPSLPVRTDNNGLIYPRQGETICTSHEIEAAKNMGARIDIKQGIIVPWASDTAAFTHFMQEVRTNRKKHPKGGIYERLWKEIGNSLYGKLAQGLRTKNTFDVETGLSKQLPFSPITNAFFAAYVTGMARAVLSEMLHSIPSNKTVASVTTDGFLTNATLDEIDLSGPLASRFRMYFHQLDPDGGEILELKHGAQQLVVMKNRGQLTAIPSVDPELSPVTAKAGVRPPGDVSDQNQYMLDLYLNREPGQKHDATHLISTREQFLNESDMLHKNREKRLSLEPDMKRKLIKPRMVDVSGTTHIFCESEPFETVEDMLFTRMLFDRWRENRCLKTLEDIYHFWDWQAMQLAKRGCQDDQSYRVKPDESSGQFMARLFIRGYAAGSWGFTADPKKRAKGQGLKAVGKWLTEMGFPISENTAKQGCKGTSVVNNAVPLTQETHRLYHLLREQFPDGDCLPIFTPEAQQDLLRGIIPIPG